MCVGESSESEGHKNETADNKTDWGVRELDRHLLDSGDVCNEGVVVHEVEKLLQLMEVRQEVVTDPLKEHKPQLRQPIRADVPLTEATPPLMSQCDTDVDVHKDGRQEVPLVTATVTLTMTSARPGLHSCSQRRGVMPLVLF